MKRIVLRRIIALSAISALCLTAGLAYGIATGDKILVIMSVIICMVNVFKMWNLKNVEKHRKYIVIEGTCLESSYSVLNRCRICKLATEEDTLEISVPKTVKPVTGSKYVFYFKEFDIKLIKETLWLKNKLLSEKFIGYEENTEGGNE